MGEKAKKVGAAGILLTMFGGLIQQAYSQIRLNQIDIVKIQEQRKSDREILIEIKQDVKEIRKVLNGN